LKPERISKLADSLRKESIGAVLVGPSPDLEYLTGLTLHTMRGSRGYLFCLMEASSI
jgi:hypothetical protein